MRTILYVIYCLDFIRFSRSIKVGTKDDASFTEYEWKIDGTCEFCEIPQLLREGFKKKCVKLHTWVVWLVGQEWDKLHRKNKKKHAFKIHFRPF